MCKIVKKSTKSQNIFSFILYIYIGKKKNTHFVVLDTFYNFFGPKYILKIKITTVLI